MEGGNARTVRHSARVPVHPPRYVLLATEQGDYSVFNIPNMIYRSSVPVSSNGVQCLCLGTPPRPSDCRCYRLLLAAVGVTLPCVIEPLCERGGAHPLARRTRPARAHARSE